MFCADMLLAYHTFHPNKHLLEQVEVWWPLPGEKLCKIFEDAWRSWRSQWTSLSKILKDIQGSSKVQPRSSRILEGPCVYLEDICRNLKDLCKILKDLGNILEDPYGFLIRSSQIFARSLLIFAVTSLIFARSSNPCRNL